MSNQQIVAELVETPSHLRPTQPSKAKLLLIPILLSLLGLMIGSAIGLFFYASAHKGYESQCKILFETESDSDPLLHHEIISSLGMIEKCLSLDGSKLKKLKIFEDVPSDEMADFVQERLIVESRADDHSLLSLRFISADQGSSPTILNNLVLTYEKSLIRSRERQQVGAPGAGQNTDRRLMTRLEIARSGEYRVRYPISGIVSKALIGLLVGFIVGSVIALILK